jgi:acetylornithine/succinyldiaminopimelate/putrescine aminotransferase
VVKAAHEAIVTDIEDRDYIDCIASYSAINQGHLDSNIKNCYLKNINGLTVEN